MRLFVGVFIALIALVLCAAGALYLALPWLIAPTSAAPAAPPSTDATALLTALRPGSGSQESVHLDVAQLDQVLAMATGGGQGPITSMWATLGSGTVDLHLDATVPQTVPVGRLRGRPLGVEAVLAPKAAAGGLVTLTVRGIRVGRVRLGAFVPLDRLVPAAARLIPGTRDWWSAKGASLVLDTAAAPPLSVGSTLVRAVPSAVTVTASALTVSGQAQVQLTLPAQELSSALDGALAGRGDSTVIPLLTFESGRAVLTLIGTGPTAQYVLDASITQPGVLRVAVGGPGADPAGQVANVLTSALGVTPSWLSVDAGGLTIDWRRVTPVDVGGGVRLRFLPQSVQVQPLGLVAWTEVVPA